jgi:hypothetical protein
LRLLGKVDNPRKSGTTVEANKILLTKNLENKKHGITNLGEDDDLSKRWLSPSRHVLDNG